MERWRQKEKIGYLVLAILPVVFCWMVCGKDGVFGSNVDWISQHSVLPEYFRQQFYETGQLFPEFAPNIGGGQNIYQFSYYGLYSPAVLLSYLFPFIKMGDYLIAVSVVSLTASVLLFYHWIRQRGISTGIRFGTACLFLLAAPMLYHSYNQIMFVNYMPYLCMGFLGVDRYFEKKVTGLFTISVFLMIMTSFYFSIGGILVLVIYGIYRYLENNEKAGQKISFYGFFADGFQFLLPILIAVLMSGILLVPTAMVLGGGRAVKSSPQLTSLLLPDLQIFRFMYSPYGIGLTTLVITVLLTGILYSKYYEKLLHFLCIAVLTIPVFTYLLNGGLYVRDKVWIPFLPLLCYLIAVYVEKQRKMEIPVAVGVFPAVLTLVLLLLTHKQEGDSRYWQLILADGILMLMGIVLVYWKQWYRILVVFPVCFLALYGVALHVSSHRVTERSFYEHVNDAVISQVVEQALSEETGLYRMEQQGSSDENAANLNRIWSMDQYVSSLYSSAYNPEYQNFRKETFELEQPYRNVLMQPTSCNPVFQRLMGVKYVLSENEVAGYRKWKETGTADIYKNETVLSVIYATNSVMNEEEYRKLEFPYNQTALLDYAIVKSEGVKDLQKDSVFPVEMELPQQSNGEATIRRTEDGYKIHTDKVENVVLEIGEHKEADTLFLQFEVKNQKPSKDISIWVDGVKNKLTARQHPYYNENTTFTYAVPLKEGQKTVYFGLGAGTYEISRIRCYAGTIADGTKNLCQSSFEIDQAKTKGNRIAGKIQAKTDGYMITSIPFDKGLEVLVDGKPVKAEKVNTAFLGSRLSKGTHQVEIAYHAPGALAGKILSLMGAALWGLLTVRRKKVR